MPDCALLRMLIEVWVNVLRAQPMILTEPVDNHAATADIVHTANHFGPIAGRQDGSLPHLRM
jgi:hypothetical protein